MNAYHRRFCSSAGWGKTLQSTVLPWVLRDYQLGDSVLEIGPGPGLATDVLRHKFDRLTCIEIDERLAESLKQRMDGTNVTVENADATEMPFEDGSFSGAISMAAGSYLSSNAQKDIFDKELREAEIMA